MAPGGDPIRDGAVAIAADGAIAAVGPLRARSPPSTRTREIFGDGNGVVMPGLVNAHTHLTECLIPGHGRGRGAVRVVRADRQPGGQGHRPATTSPSAPGSRPPRCCAAAITTVNDMSCHRNMGSLATLGAVDGLAAAGMRGVVSFGAEDVYDGAPGPDVFMAEHEALADRIADEQLIYVPLRHRDVLGITMRCSTSRWRPAASTAGPSTPISPRCARSSPRRGCQWRDRRSSTSARKGLLESRRDRRALHLVHGARHRPARVEGRLRRPQPGGEHAARQRRLPGAAPAPRGDHGRARHRRGRVERQPGHVRRAQDRGPAAQGQHDGSDDHQRAPGARDGHDRGRAGARPRRPRSARSRPASAPTSCCWTATRPSSRRSTTLSSRSSTARRLAASATSGSTATSGWPAVRSSDVDLPALAGEAREAGAELVRRAGHRQRVRLRRARAHRSRRVSAADVVVIGAGHNGLACGSYLAREGLDVVVVEQARRSRAAAWPRSSFRRARDASSSARSSTAASAASGVADDLELESRFGLEWLLRDELVLAPCDDGTQLAMHNSLERTVEGFAELMGREEAERYREFADGPSAAIGVLGQADDGPPPSIRELAALADLTLGSEGPKLIQALFASSSTLTAGRAWAIRACAGCSSTGRPTHSSRPTIRARRPARSCWPRFTALRRRARPAARAARSTRWRVAWLAMGASCALAAGAERIEVARRPRRGRGGRRASASRRAARSSPRSTPAACSSALLDPADVPGGARARGRRDPRRACATSVRAQGRCRDCRAAQARASPPGFEQALMLSPNTDADIEAAFARVALGEMPERPPLMIGFPSTREPGWTANPDHEVHVAVDVRPLAAGGGYLGRGRAGDLRPISPGPPPSARWALRSSRSSASSRARSTGSSAPATRTRARTTSRCRSTSCSACDPRPRWLATRLRSPGCTSPAPARTRAAASPGCRDETPRPSSCASSGSAGVGGSSAGADRPACCATRRGRRGRCGARHEPGGRAAARPARRCSPSTSGPRSSGPLSRRALPTRSPPGPRDADATSRASWAPMPTRPRDCSRRWSRSGSRTRADDGFALSEAGAPLASAADRVDRRDRAQGVVLLSSVGDPAAGDRRRPRADRAVARAPARRPAAVARVPARARRPRDAVRRRHARARRLDSGGRLLDVGGGAGSHSAYLEAAVDGLEATVLDLPEAEPVLRERHPELAFVAGRLRRAPLRQPGRRGVGLRPAREHPSRPPARRAAPSSWPRPRVCSRPAGRC